MIPSVVEISSIMTRGTQKNKKKVQADKRHKDYKKNNFPDELSEKCNMFNHGPQHGGCEMCDDCKSEFESLKQHFERFEEDSDGDKEKADEGILDYVDWCPSSRSELQSLVMCNLNAVFKNALKKIVACGYSEEVATKAVMSPGICYGPKDTMSNIVDNTLKILKTRKVADLKGYAHCKDQKELEDYLLGEFIYVLRFIRPFSSPGDMFWYMLVSDLNVSDACALVFGRYDISDYVTSNVISDPLPKSHLDDAIRRLDMDFYPPFLQHMSMMSSSSTDFQRDFSSWFPNKMESKNTKNPTKQSREDDGAQSSMNAVDWSCFVSRTSQRLEAKGKFGSSSKVRISGTIKRDSNFAQKLHHVDKGCQTHGYSKSFFKQGKLFGFAIDKKTRSSVERYSKNASVKINKAVEVNNSEDRTKCNRTTIKGDVNPTSCLCSRCVASSMRAVSSPGADSPQMKRQPKQASRDGPVDVSSCSHESTKIKGATGQSTKPDQKTITIFHLISKIYKLDDQLEDWSEWANSRVMQATIRLTKHKDELNVLRQEKNDPERLKKSIKESTLRKLSEIEIALSKVNEQVECGNCAVRNLEVKNSALKCLTDAAKLEAVESADNCHKVSEREMSAMSSVKSSEKQKSLLHEELISLKHKYEHSQKELIQAKGVLAHHEVKREIESQAKTDLRLKASSIKMEIEQVEALRKIKEDAFRSNAEVNLQKYKDDIQMLEREVVKLNLSAKSKKTSTLTKGLNGGRVSRLISSSQKCPMFPDVQLAHMRMVAHNSLKKGAKDLKRDRECVMCLSEEISVVFLPCAHQVICAKCNELHEKKGMKDCPSCRSVIRRRIVVRYHVP